MKLYRDFATQEEIDAHYNMLAKIADADATIAAWASRSAEAVARLDCRLDVRFGPTLAEYCDVFPAGPGAPLHLFVHGGYWRRFSARDHAFVAPQLVAAGITTITVNYALCPTVSLDEIVAAAPEVVLLPDEPYAFGAADEAELRRLPLPAATSGRIHRIDGTWVSWYGPRIRPALRAIRSLLVGSA